MWGPFLILDFHHTCPSAHRQHKHTGDPQTYMSTKRQHSENCPPQVSSCRAQRYPQHIQTKGTLRPQMSPSSKWSLLSDWCPCPRLLCKLDTQAASLAPTSHPGINTSCHCYLINFSQPPLLQDTSNTTTSVKVPRMAFLDHFNWLLLKYTPTNPYNSPSTLYSQGARTFQKADVIM